MRVRPVLEEELHNSCVAIAGCQTQRPFATSVYVCARVEEQLHCIHVPVSCRRWRCPWSSQGVSLPPVIRLIRHIRIGRIVIQLCW